MFMVSNIILFFFFFFLFSCSWLCCYGVEVYQVTTNLGDQDTGEVLQELKFYICSNEDVINAVADEFIDFSQSISPEVSDLSDQLYSLKNMICNEYNGRCQREHPSSYLDSSVPFTIVTLSNNETYRISMREGQNAFDLTDCFCTVNKCTYHEGKSIEQTLAMNIAQLSNKRNED